MKFIAFYLPQYHRIPENDAWWGDGFTDWVNVKKARPRFKGHHQPHIPAETVGYYDLTDPEVREKQAAMAKEFGIDAFCYYHYWFNGSRLLSKPLDGVLQLKKPDFPFCICWANENWTRAWDGTESKILIKQNYSKKDHDDHIQWMLPVFKDPRYLKIGGKPVLLLYRSEQIEYLDYFVEEIKKQAILAGFPGAYVCAIRSGFLRKNGNKLRSEIFDAIVDFQPNKREFPGEPFFVRALRISRRLFFRLQKLFTNTLSADEPELYRSMNYRSFVKKAIRNQLSDSSVISFPCVFPSWDNSARRNLSDIIQNTDGKAFYDWLRAAVQFVSKKEPEEQIVFINAWNEWAEGCHLEPDRELGTTFLEVVKRVAL
jgi:lipopolysaccharide biosynthesis protein